MTLNKQIHNEASSYFYGSGDFEIRLSGGNINFLNDTERLIYNDFPLSVTEPSEHDRISIMSNDQDGGHPFRRNYQPRERMGKFDRKRPGSIGGWGCPIPMRYFNLINHFNITINLRPDVLAPHYRSGGLHQIPYHTNTHNIWRGPLPAVFPPGSNQRERDIMDLRIYSTIDLLHVLIDHLQKSILGNRRTRPNIAVTILHGTSVKGKEEVIDVTIALLKPFLRLRNLSTARISSVAYGQFNNEFVNEKSDLMTQDPVPKPVDDRFRQFVQAWSGTISQPLEFPANTEAVEPVEDQAADTKVVLPQISLMPLESGQLFPVSAMTQTTSHTVTKWPLPLPSLHIYYNHLQVFVATLKHYYILPAPTNLCLLRSLHSARVAREEDDSVRFQEAWEAVLIAHEEILEGERRWRRGERGESLVRVVAKEDGGRKGSQEGKGVDEHELERRELLRLFSAMRG